MSIHRWFTGFFLLLLMVAALFTNAWVFAARSFQDNFARISGNESAVVSMDQVREISRQVNEVEIQSAPREAQLATLMRSVDDANARIDALIKQVDGALGVLSAKVAAVEQKLNMTTTIDDTLGGVESRVDRLEQSAAATSKPDIAPLRAQLDQIDAWNADIVAKTEARHLIENEARAIQSAVNADRQRLLSAKAQFGENFDEVVAEIESLRHTSPYGFGVWLVELHPTFLSIALVWLMGAMGALLFLFPAYIANRPGMEVTFDTIIVRTVFGMLVALAFLVVANAGLAVLGSTGTPMNASVEKLNPFSIAALGIIAGVMGDDIAKWIHERGAFLFKGASSGGGLADIARGAIKPTKQDLPSGGLINPHGGPNDPA